MNGTIHEANRLVAVASEDHRSLPRDVHAAYVRALLGLGVLDAKQQAECVRAARERYELGAANGVGGDDALQLAHLGVSIYELDDCEDAQSALDAALAQLQRVRDLVTVREARYLWHLLELGPFMDSEQDERVARAALHVLERLPADRNALLARAFAERLLAYTHLEQCGDDESEDEEPGEARSEGAGSGGGGADASAGKDSDSAAEARALAAERFAAACKAFTDAADMSEGQLRGQILEYLGELLFASVEAHPEQEQELVRKALDYLDESAKLGHDATAHAPDGTPLAEFLHGLLAEYDA